MSDRLLIDTNLLLLMIIGAVDNGKYIEKSKRLGGFCFEDYRQLWEMVPHYKEVGITSYIAAEVSNLIDLDGQAGEKAFAVAKRVFKEFNQIDTSITEDCNNIFFSKFGLTDSSIIQLSTRFDILTNDRKMLIPLYSASPDSIVPYIPVNRR